MVLKKGVSQADKSCQHRFGGAYGAPGRCDCCLDNVRFHRALTNLGLYLTGIQGFSITPDSPRKGGLQ